jgi:hypothetical protein
LTITYEEEVTFKSTSGAGGKKDPRLEGIEVLVVVVTTWYEGTTAAGAPIEDLTEAVEGYVVLLRNTYGEKNVRVVGAGYDAGKAEDLRAKKGSKLQPFHSPVEETWREGMGLEVREYEPGVSVGDFTNRKSITWEEVLDLFDLEEEAKNKYDQIHFVGHGDRPKGEGEGRIPGGMIFQTHTGHHPPVIKKKDGEWEGDLAKLSETIHWPLKEDEDVKGYVGDVKVVLAGCFSCSGRMKEMFGVALGDTNVHCVPGKIFYAEPEKDAAGKTKRDEEGNVIMKGWYDYDETIQGIARFLGIPEE